MDALSYIDSLQRMETGQEGPGGLSYWSERLLTDRAEAAAWCQQHGSIDPSKAANDDYTVDAEPDLPA
ncbi:hypothetical protein [Crenobacter cavernae]|uniref:DUF4214 domain-containing protein n=1 Tax=Crenobacter cavernae TaxID=2290923 RepID=A0ABY0FAB6_9NEIS|nr:hypothetical protein [Crenobacter cavernae]RXZ42581.1 hypothetical protein EBB06_11800 [Crenobacter cavernae]